MKTRNLGLLALATSSLVLGFAGTVSAAPANSDNKIQNVNSRGSDTSFTMDQKLSDIYVNSEGCVADTGNADRSKWITCAATQPGTVIQTENYDHDVPVQYDPQAWGSGKGLTALCQQNSVVGTGILADVVPTEIARSSRPPVASDCTGLLGRGYAKDAIIPLTFRTLAGSSAVGVTNLTTAQLVGIFSTCTITNWNQIGSAISAPIIVWGIQTGSGTYKAFANAIGVANANACVTQGDPDGAGPLTSYIVQENDAQQIRSAGDTIAKDSIWFMSFGPYQASNNLRAGSSLSRVNSVTPNGTSILNGTFPLNRYLYMVTRPGTAVPGHDAARGAATDFVNWVCKNAGGHTTTLNKQYGTLIGSAVASEGFYRMADNSGTNGTDTCQDLALT